MDEKMKELEKLAKPIVEFLRKNYHPHAQVTILWDFVTLNEEIFGIPLPIKEE